MNINKIYLGDCLELMKNIPDKSVDMILCDLPYGMTACSWDTIIPLDKLWEQYKRVRKDNTPIILFGSQPFTTALITSNMFEFKYEWIWQKTRPTGFFTAKKMPMKIHENIVVFYKSQPVYNPIKTKADESKIDKRKTLNGTFCKYLNTFTERGVDDGFRYPISVQIFNSISEKGQHPTQKPVALFEYLIKTYTNEGEIVLDNCIGSGTTAIAAINTNRQFIGIEKEEKYFDIATERIEKAKHTLFANI